MRGPAEVIDVVRRELAHEQHLRWAYVFGSVARGTAYRDVDVAIMPGPSMPKGLVAIGHLVARLESALGTKVDLADLTHAELPFVGPMLRERIVVLDHDREARHRWEAETTSRWLDFRPWWEEGQRIRDLARRQRLRGGR